MPLVILTTLWKKEDGATAIEYGLIAALVAIGGAGALSNVGANIGSTFAPIAEALSTGSTTAASLSGPLKIIVKDQERTAGVVN